jgi:LemA protein
MDLLLWVILGLVVIAGLWALFTYNRFVTLVNRTKEAWADIEVQMKRRYDLIPNLVETVKGYMTHERQTLDSVTQARSQAVNAQGTKEQAEAENMLTGTLRTLFAVAENYPDLKANANFLELQRELTDTEDKIQAARRFYNTNVRDLNTMLEQAPSNIIGNMFNFEPREFFELAEDQEAAREPVAVKF